MMNIVFSMLLYYLSLFCYIIILLNKSIIILLNKSIIILFRSTKLFYLANAKMVGGLECFPISANDVSAKIFFIIRISYISIALYPLSPVR